MDIWKYYAITHRQHVICNPLSLVRLHQLIELLRLPPGARVLDIASGKGEFLIRLGERFGAIGVGVDISPYFLAEAKERAADRVLEAQLQFLELDGAAYQPESPASFDFASCLGADWIFGGYRPTLERLKELVKPGGQIAIGEPFWLKKPALDYLAAEQLTREQFGTHLSNAKAGAELGLELLYTVVSTKEDFDRYEGLQWYSAERYAREHPDDPDLPEVLERVKKGRDVYLRWGRDTVGWAVYLFRK